MEDLRNHGFYGRFLLNPRAHSINVTKCNTYFLNLHAIIATNIETVRMYVCRPIRAQLVRSDLAHAWSTPRADHYYRGHSLSKFVYSLCLIVLVVKKLVQCSCVFGWDRSASCSSIVGHNGSKVSTQLEILGIFGSK